MNKYLIINILALVLFLLVMSCKNKTDSTAIKVEIKNENGKFILYRGGQPYSIKGAGCEYGDFENLAAHGANSVRTWRIDNNHETGQQVLDKAQKNGLTILMGLTVVPERHGFNYDNVDSIKIQFEKVKSQVTKYKDHPALLAWGVGNELNMNYTNKKVWNAINDIARMIHEVDPNHPVTTMLAGIKKVDIDYIKENCKELDFISVQMYGDAINIIKRVNDAGWDGPYVVSEWGATGHWEMPSTEWKIPIEQTSSEKTNAIIERYTKAISANPDKCIGNYVFIWEQKQERTPTWYGLFLENGEETEMIDAMQFLWTSSWPKNRTPVVDSVFLDKRTRFQNIHLKSKKEYSVDVFTHDIENDTITISSEVLPDQPELFKHGGDFEQRPKNVDCMIEIDNIKHKIKFISPENYGPYRIFAYVRDGHGHAATANIPFFVDK